MKRKLCEDCGAVIPKKRLAAKPDARYCVDCQAAYDPVPVAFFKSGEKLDDVTDLVVLFERRAEEPTETDLEKEP